MFNKNRLKLAVASGLAWPQSAYEEPVLKDSNSSYLDSREIKGHSGMKLRPPPSSQPRDWFVLV